MIIDKLNKLGSSVVVLAVVAPPKSKKLQKMNENRHENRKIQKNSFSVG